MAYPGSPLVERPSPETERLLMPLMNIARLERFFRLAASLDVDKEDLRRYEEFVDRKLRDLLLRAQANAKANNRDVMAAHDLPVTKGLQERIHEFRAMDGQIDTAGVFDALVKRPQMDLAYGEDLEAALPRVVGGLSVALAKSFRVIEPGIKNPQTPHWERAFELFDLLL